jgi:ABC-type molybdate transport system substrate-binding protein
MWNGVAHTFRKSLDVVKTPYEYDEEIRVHIIGLSYSEEPELLRQFITFARTKGPDTFADYGYVK